MKAGPRQCFSSMMFFMVGKRQIESLHIKWLWQEYRLGWDCWILTDTVESQATWHGEEKAARFRELIRGLTIVNATWCDSMWHYDLPKGLLVCSELLPLVDATLRWHHPLHTISSQMTIFLLPSAFILTSSQLLGFSFPQSNVFERFRSACSIPPISNGTVVLISWLFSTILIALTLTVGYFSISVLSTLSMPSASSKVMSESIWRWYPSVSSSGLM